MECFIQLDIPGSKLHTKMEKNKGVSVLHCQDLFKIIWMIPNMNNYE